MTQLSCSRFLDRLRDQRIYFQCFYGAYVVGLHHWLPIDVVSCLDSGTEMELIRARTGVEFLAAEAVGTPRRSSIGCGIDQILSDCRERALKVLHSKPSQQWVVISSPPSPALEALCREHAWRYLGPSPHRFASLQGKRAALAAFTRLQLPRMRGRWVPRGDLRYEELGHEFGRSFVVQTDRGSAGAGTALISNAAELETLALQMSEGEAGVFVAERMSDLSFNINAAVVAGRVCVGFPSVQLAGVRALNTPWGGYCGNDFTAAAQGDAALVRDVQEQTQRVGEWLLESGFEGLYGLDFVIGASDGRAYPIDLNPRWQGSTSLSVQLETAQGRVPLAVAALLAGNGCLTGDEVEHWLDAFRAPLVGAQLCLRIPTAGDRRITQQVLPGAYAGAGGGLEFSRAEISLADCGADEWLLTCGVPSRGTLLQQGGWIARLQTHSRVSEGTSSTLTESAAQAVARFYEWFALEPATHDWSARPGTA